MLIAIDVDDTIAAFGPQLLKVYNGLDGTSYTSRDIKSYNLEKLWGCTKEEAVKRINDFYNMPGFSDIVPVVGSQEAIDLLASRNRLIVITSRPSTIGKQTEEWLDRYFKGKFAEVYYTSEWHNVNGGRGKKADICVAKHVKTIVDDCLEYVLACREAGTPGLLFDLDGNYGWNKTSGYLHGIERVHSWREVLQSLGYNVE